VTERPSLTGQEIALAANATRALLDALLAELGTSAAIVDRLYAGLPVDDQLTTRRILETVTERANAELAGAAAPKTTTKGA
jgi:hypothetical protein